MPAAELTAAMEEFADTKVWKPILDQALQEVSKSGKSSFEWAALKGILAVKVEATVAEYYEATKDLHEPYEELLKRLLALLAEFPNAPFTIQRLCELLLDPHRIYYTSTRKVCSAIEKLLTVSSTVPVMQVAVPRAGTYQAAAEAELKALVGGDGEPMEVEQ